MYSNCSNVNCSNAFGLSVFDETKLVSCNQRIENDDMKLTLLAKLVSCGRRNWVSVIDETEFL